jgi:hypothetical protein
MAGQQPQQNQKTAGGKMSAGSVLTCVVLLVALAVGTYALVRLDSWGNGNGKSPERFKLKILDQIEIPEDLLAYSESRRINVSLKIPTAVATAQDGDVYVIGDNAVEMIRPDDSRSVFTLNTAPTCLAVVEDDDSTPRRIYVGGGRRITVLDEKGEVIEQWPQIHAKSILTAMTVAGDNIFVADAGQKLVLRYDRSGKLIGTIGETDLERPMPGFVIPSPHFDLAAAPDAELLHVANPGMRRVEAYNYDGELQTYWGREGPRLADFFGCCNPAHLTLMDDGKFITSEKGIPRIKVYTETGELLHVVAGPNELGVPAGALGDARGNQQERVFDIAVDQAGKVLVLDSRQRQVIVFERSVAQQEAES